MKNAIKKPPLKESARQFRSFGTIFTPLKEALEKYLRHLNISFVAVKCGNDEYDFNISCDLKEADLVNRWISANSILNVEA